MIMNDVVDENEMIVVNQDEMIVVDENEKTINVIVSRKYI
jgi:hypothetical protein